MAGDQAEYDRAVAYLMDATTELSKAIRVVGVRNCAQARQAFDATILPAQFILNQLEAGQGALAISEKALSEQVSQPANDAPKKVSAVPRTTFEFSVLGWFRSKRDSFVHKRDALDALTELGLHLGDLQAFSTRLGKLKGDGLLDWEEGKLMPIKITHKGEEKLLELSRPGKVRDNDRVWLIERADWAAELLAA